MGFNSGFKGLIVIFSVLVAYYLRLKVFTRWSYISDCNLL